MKHVFSKKGLAWVLAVMMALSLTAALAESQGTHLDKIVADQKIVVATSPDYPPYEFMDMQGNIVGADIKLAEYIAEKLGVELVIEALDFDTVLAAVTGGTVDLGIAGMVPKDERRESMEFSDIYYNDGNQVIVILKENADKIKTLADFDGKTVGAQNGTLQQELVMTQLPGATMEQIVKIPDGIMSVMTKKIDGIALASVVANQYVANYPDLVICETMFEYEPLGVSIAMPKGETALKEAIDGIVLEIMDSGIYFEWMEEAVELANSLAQ